MSSLFWELSYSPSLYVLKNKVSLKFQIREVHTCSAQSLMTNEDAEAAGGRARTSHVRRVVCLRWRELSVCVVQSSAHGGHSAKPEHKQKKSPASYRPSAQNTSAAHTEPLSPSIFISISFLPFLSLSVSVIVSCN